MMRKDICCIIVVLLGVRLGIGGVFFDQERNVLRVTDYPPEAPCDLTRLAEADRALGWGRVSYDEASNICVVVGDLVIGSNDGSETVLQIGSAERTNETLVMRGNLYVAPYWIQGGNAEKSWQAPKMNAIMLGNPTNKTIKAALKFACTPTNKWSLSCGEVPWIDKNKKRGSGVYVFNSQIAALDPAPGCEISVGKQGVCSTVFDGALISGVASMLYRMAPCITNLIRNAIFERVGVPLAGGAQKMSGCKFINCGTAVMDQGDIDAELTDCVFQGNDHNWSLTSSDKGLTCIDCTWDAPHKGDMYRSWTNAVGKVQHPKFTSRRHVVVEVLDAAGKPVKNVTVTFKAQQAGCDLLPGRKYETGLDGRTPEKNQDGALQLTEYIKTATGTPDKPDVQTFTYAITAETKDKQATVENIAPNQSWKIVTLTLK